MSAEVSLLGRLLTRTKWRMRAQRALDSACTGLLLGACGGSLYLLLAQRDAPLVASGLIACALLAGLSGLAWPVSSERAALALDLRERLAGRMLAAWEFARVPEAARTPFAEAALRDAAEHARRASPTRAAPLSRPRRLLPALLVTACFGLLALYSARPGSAGTVADRRPAERKLEEHGERASMARDDLEAYAARRRELLARAGDDAELREHAERTAQLLAAIARGSLTREQAVQQLYDLEEQLARSSDAELARSVRDALRALGAPGERKARAESEAPKLAAWSEALRGRTLDAKERTRLEQTIARARSELGRREAEQADAGLEGDLLRKKTASTPDPRSEPNLLDDKQRELERLRREHEQRSAARRELERLRRELDRAAHSLGSRADEQAADALDRANEAMDRLQNKADLARDLAQAREQLQRQRESEQRDEGKPRGSEREQRESAEERRERFRLRARGEQEDGGLGLALGGGDAGGLGDAGAGSSIGRTLRLGQGSSEQSELTLESESVSSAATGAGDEHDPTRDPEAERQRGRYEERKLEGAKGAGPSRSQVIGGAAQSGFAAAPYRKVYADYRAHAEQLLERDEVPPGYRFYVQRYFQLVRPRAGEGAP